MDLRLALIFVILNTLTSCYGNDGGLDLYGLLPICPGSDKPAYVTEGFLKKEVYFLVQKNLENGTLYRKRYYFGRAIEGLRTDPHLDFKNKKTVIYLSGYLDSVSLFYGRLVFNAYPSETYNKIAVDWVWMSAFVYPRVARLVPQMGNLTAYVLSGLRQYGLRAQDIEVMGYSMGGMTAAFTGKHYYRLTGEKVSKITSLDPSGPCFRNAPPEHRLSRDDAHFVQVIHDSGTSFSFAKAVGHVDFYINGGDYQHFLNDGQSVCDEICGHLVALGHFYSMMKHDDKFVGIKCNTVEEARQHRCFDNKPFETNIMGPKADRNKPGIYYVPVMEYPPFYVNTSNLNDNPLLYNDALNRKEHFVLSTKSRKVSGFMRSIINIGNLFA